MRETLDHIDRLIDEAAEALTTARDAMAAARPMTAAWRKAGEDRDWWVGRLAYLKSWLTDEAAS